MSSTHVLTGKSEDAAEAEHMQDKTFTWILILSTST